MKLQSISKVQVCKVQPWEFKIGTLIFPQGKDLQIIITKSAHWCAPHTPKIITFTILKEWGILKKTIYSKLNIQISWLQWRNQDQASLPKWKKMVKVYMNDEMMNETRDDKTYIDAWEICGNMALSPCLSSSSSASWTLTSGHFDSQESIISLSWMLRIDFPLSPGHSTSGFLWGGYSTFPASPDQSKSITFK